TTTPPIRTRWPGPSASGMMAMNRGEVWQVAFDPTIGAEIRKTRPAVIVSSSAVGALPLPVVVPFTGWQPEFAGAAWMVRVEPTLQNGLAKSSAADAFRIKSFSTRRLLKRMGILSAEDLQAVIRAIGEVIEYR